jgi:hypothetical protein
MPENLKASLPLSYHVSHLGLDLKKICLFIIVHGESTERLFSSAQADVQEVRPRKMFDRRHYLARLVLKHKTWLTS